MSKEIATILERAADRLSKPGAWTQGYYAKSADEMPVSPKASSAVCWCMEGAILADKLRWPDYCAAVDFLRVALSVLDSATDNPIASFNDAPERTQAEVVAKLREAAAKARAGQ